MFPSGRQASFNKYAHALNTVIRSVAVGTLLSPPEAPPAPPHPPVTGPLTLWLAPRLPGPLTREADQVRATGYRASTAPQLAKCSACLSPSGLTPAQEQDQLVMLAPTAGMRRPRQVPVRDAGPQTGYFKAAFIPGSCLAKGADQAVSQVPAHTPTPGSLAWRRRWGPEGLSPRETTQGTSPNQAPPRPLTRALPARRVSTWCQRPATGRLPLEERPGAWEPFPVLQPERLASDQDCFVLLGIFAAVGSELGVWEQGAQQGLDSSASAGGTSLPSCGS